jgi:hypothetical protein
VDDIKLSTQPDLDTGLFLYLPNGSLLKQLTFVLLSLREAPVVILFSMDEQYLDVLPGVSPANDTCCVNRH